MLLLRFTLSADRLVQRHCRASLTCAPEREKRRETQEERKYSRRLYKLRLRGDFKSALRLRGWDRSGSGLFPAKCPPHPPDPTSRAPVATTRAALTGRYLTGSHPTAVSRSLSPPSALGVEAQPSTPFPRFPLSLF